MFDLRQDTSLVYSIEPKAKTDGTVLGAEIDLKGFDSNLVVFMYGTWTDGTHTPALLDSADGTTYAATTEYSGTVAAISGTTNDVGLQVIQYTGTKRYIKPRVITATSTVGLPVGAVAVRSNAKYKPATT